MCTHFLNPKFISEKACSHSIGGEGIVLWKFGARPSILKQLLVFIFPGIPRAPDTQTVLHAEEKKKKT